MGTEATSDLRLPLRYFYAIAALGAVAAAILAAKRVLRLYADRTRTRRDPQWIGIWSRCSASP